MTDTDNRFVQLMSNTDQRLAQLARIPFGRGDIERSLAALVYVCKDQERRIKELEKRSHSL